MRKYRIQNSHSPKVSVVIPVVNERKTIVRVIQQARGVHQDTEVIVVANGSTDGTKQTAEKIGAKVIYFEKRLGHDVGRSIGAREAKGDIIVFTDGDIVIPSKQFVPLILAVQHGIDVALNKYLGITRRKNVHNVVLAKHALNIALSRPDLRGASMTTVPHAISRKALEVIGVENLAVPPKALAIAVQSGLAVRAVHYIDVGRLNPRKRRGYKVDPLEKLIVGDHIEALEWLINCTDVRGNMPDLERMRDIVR